ncbi:MAG: YraN family protein [Nitrospirota bacterium]
MKLSTIFIGKSGEDVAEKYLKKRGYRIIEKNYKSPYGEIDIVALDKGTISFIEVKYRRSEEFGPPEISVDSKKRLRLTKSALHFLARKRIKDTPCRFDVISITETQNSKGHKIELIKDAFEMERTF